jgi:hypothetical protein
MSIEELIHVKHEDVRHSDKIAKILYINELLRLDPIFDENIRVAMTESINRGTIPSKKVTLSEFSDEELLDMLNPISK